MSWDSDRVLEGIFQFGAPLNIWKIELYKESNGDLGYFRIHMLLDDDADLAGRLKMKISAGSGGEFQRLIIMEGPKTRSVQAEHWIEHYFYDAWLYSLQTDYSPSYYPFSTWKGTTLGIGLHKTKANIAAVQRLFHNYRSM